jgi:hypothetical protein
MERLNRKKRTYDDLSSGGIFDLVDNIIKSSFRITDQEYDYIIEHVSDLELEFLTKKKLTFSEKRELIMILNKYLSEFNKT